MVMSLKKLEMAKRIAKAETRIAGLHSIDEKLDLGNGLSLDNHRSVLQQLRDKIHTYNKLLSDVDALRDECKLLGRHLDDQNFRMIAAVGAKYGRESAEYVKAGGTRPSDRKKGKAAPGKASA